jgi:hypothetical protein
MPTKIKKDDLLKLETLSDDVRADIAALFADVEERENRISDLTKAAADADEIVKRAPEVEKERDALKTEKLALESKLAEITGKSSDEITLTAFAPFFDL